MVNWFILIDIGIIIMSHDYNTRNKKKSAEMSQDSLDKLEKSIVQSINSLKDEIINLKDIVIKKLQD